MDRTSIKNIGLFKVRDLGEGCYGCTQKWYGAFWKRMAGCGPTTFANVMSYYDGSGHPDAAPMAKGDYLRLMNDIWKFVTPGLGGISTTGALIRGISAYTECKKLALSTDELTIPALPDERPSPGNVAAFLIRALSRDLPVAFLSLDKGKEEPLDTWHWVTLVAVERDGSSLFADILDDCRLLRADLRNWYDTTSRGGGFVGFSRTGAADPPH